LHLGGFELGKRFEGDLVDIGGEVQLAAGA
jgi:hypothetical protein